MPFPPLPAPARLVSGLLVQVLLLLCAALPARAATFRLPDDGSNIVGRVQVVAADARNTLLDIARHYELGYHEITVANPGVSVWLPGEGTPIVVPAEFILPPKPWTGIVINIPQRRLFYFPRPRSGEPGTVVTFPIGVARPGWPTPLGQTRITAKYKDPSWIVPQSILAEHRSQGEPDFPEYFPPGPDNPMGLFALKTGFEQILIHGTNRPWGVGMRVSHGCIRMYPEHSAELFSLVPVDTPVRIVNQAVLAGSRGSELYLSVFDPVEDYPGGEESLVKQATDALMRYDRPPDAAEIDGDRLRKAVMARRFMPEPVSVGAPALERIIASIKPEPYAYEPYGVDANNAALPKASR